MQVANVLTELSHIDVHSRDQTRVLVSNALDIKTHDSAHHRAELLNACVMLSSETIPAVNKLVVDQALRFLTDNEPESICQVVYEGFVTSVSRFGDQMQEKLSSDNFSLSDFKDQYNKLYERTGRLSYYFSEYDRVIRPKLNNRCKSFVNLCRSVALYNGLIRRNFTYSGKSYDFYTLLGVFLGKSVSDFESMIPFMSMSSYFNKLNSMFSSDKNGQLLDISDNYGFTKSMGSNPQFIEVITKHVDNYLRDMCKLKHDSSEYKKKKDGVLNMCKLINSFEEKDMIFMRYYRLMLDRIFMSMFNHVVEKEALDTFKIVDNDIYSKMKYLIADMMMSEQNHKIFKEVKVSASSGAFTSEMINGMNRSAFTPVVLRQYSCPAVSGSHSIQLPEEMSIYVTIFSRVYGVRYVDQRKLRWEFDFGHTILDLNMSGKIYQVLMEVPQSAVVVSLVKNGVMTAAALSDLTKIPLQRLGQILTGLLMARIIVRSQGDATDPNNKFGMNTEFSFSSEKFSLVGLTDRASKSQDEFAVGKTNILKARFVKLAKSEPTRQFTADELLTEAKKSLLFEPTSEMVSDVLNTLTDTDYLKKSDDDKYSYLEAAESDEESDSDSEDDTDDAASGDE